MTRKERPLDWGRRGQFRDFVGGNVLFRNNRTAFEQDGVFVIGLLPAGRLRQVNRAIAARQLSQELD